MGNGRKTKLTPEVQEKIISALKAGNYFNHACVYAGVAPNTGEEWKSRGEGTDKDRPVNALYANFAKAVREAESFVQVRMISQWQEQMPSDWRAIEAFMKRRYPSEWGDRTRTEIVGDKDAPLTVSIAQLAKEAREE